MAIPPSTNPSDVVGESLPRMLNSAKWLQFSWRCSRDLIVAKGLILFQHLLDVRQLKPLLLQGHNTSQTLPAGIFGHEGSTLLGTLNGLRLLRPG